MSGSLECKVYVGNLGSQGSKSELERVFGDYGELTNVWVARNPPGFAFVEFAHEYDARDAVRALDGRTICGVRARVELSSGMSRQGGRQDSFRGRPRYGGYNGGGSYYRDDPYDRRRSYRSRSRSPRRRYSRSRSRSPDRYSKRRRSRSRSPVRRHSPRYRSRSRTPERRRSPVRDDRSRSPDQENGRENSRSPTPDARQSRSPSRGRSRSMD